jgi:hypothetical protein
VDTTLLITDDESIAGLLVFVGGASSVDIPMIIAANSLR